MNTQLSHRQQDAFLWFSNYRHELRLYQGGTAQNGYSTTTIDRVASLSVTGQGSGQDAGQGVGLSVVKEGAQKLGGKLFLNSKPQKSTTFSVQFKV